MNVGTPMFSLFGGSLAPVIALVVAAIVVYMLLALTGVIRKGQSVFQIGPVLSFAAEWPVLYLLKPTRWVLWKIPGVAAAFAWTQRQLTDESIERFFDWCFRPSKSHLLRGDLEAHAAQRWPTERWPHLWRADIPDDLRRPLVVDGRLIDGSYPADELAATFVDKVLVGQAFRRAVLCGVFWCVAALLLWHPHSYFAHVANYVSSELPARNVEQQGLPQDGRVSLREDVWSLNALSEKIQHEAHLQAEVEKARRDAIINTAPGGFITSMLFGVLVFFGTWRGLVRDAAQSKIEPLRRQQKEAVVRWKYRLDQREMEYNAYLAQLRTLEWDTTPLIEIGMASGVFRFRGHISAPVQRQPMRYSLQDMAQHTLVLGGTGEGKTRSMILPVVRQLLTLRKDLSAAGKPRGISFYATDGKAVLWRDIQAAAIEAGQGDVVRVIGCDRNAGQFGVDLLEGVSPQVVADIVRSVMRQAKGGGEGGDSFWPDMASEVLRCAAVLARAWEVTDDGMALISTTGERIYSLVMVYHLAIDSELQERAVRAVLTAIDDAAQWPYVAEYATPELFDATRYLRGQWLTMANDTRTGIIANVTNAMAAFASNADLRNSFANGSGRNLLKMADTWGAICLVNVSSLEYGVAGRIINVMLKTLLYMQARKREMANQKIGFDEKLLFVADEFQDLVTADVAGVSDANFWNVARSTGVIGFISTQGMASLEQAIGKTAAENFALQMRNKIFLRVEDPDTMDLAKKLAGKALRSYTFSNDRYESYEAMVRETGADPLDDGPARIVEVPDNYLLALARGWFQAHKASLPIAFDSYRQAYDADLRFVPRGGSLGQGPSVESIMSAQQAAYWRQEDKSLTYMSEGNHQADVLQDEDLISMGRAHAYVYLQRAGATRQDIAEIA